VIKYERKSPADTKLTEQREGGGATGTGARITQHLLVKIIVVSLQPMEDHGGADIHTVDCGGPYSRAGEYTLKAAAAHGEPKLEQVPGRSVAYREGPMQEQVLWQDL